MKILIWVDYYKDRGSCLYEFDTKDVSESALTFLRKSHLSAFNLNKSDPAGEKFFKMVEDDRKGIFRCLHKTPAEIRALKDKPKYGPYKELIYVSYNL